MTGPLRPGDRPLMSQRKLAAPEPAPLGADAIAPRGCKWIDGDPREPGWTWCGEPTAPGESWCPSHRMRVYRRQEDGEQP